MQIRLATNLDCENICEVHLRAFTDAEKQIVSRLAVNLLNEDTTPETISLVAEIDNKVVGHIAFSPVSVKGNPEWKGYILAPLGVIPKYQQRRIGSKLINMGMEQLSEKGVNVLFVYGDPRYYLRFGFKPETALRYLPPYELKYPFGWQAIVFNEIGLAQTTVKISCVTSLRDPELW